MHFTVADMAEITTDDVSIGGPDEDGYDYLELAGQRITTDNIVAFASFFVGLGSIMLNQAVDAFGYDNVAEEVEQIQAGLPFAEPEEPSPPLPFPGAISVNAGATAEDIEAAIQRHPSSAPDIQGRDV